MKIVSTFCILLVLSGCVFEGKPNFIYFKILNSTSDTITIAHHFKDYPTECIYDTLFPGKQLDFFVTSMSCFTQNKLDSIFEKTFDNFYVSSKDSTLNSISLFDRNNWQENAELEKTLMSEKECFKGQITFTLTLKSKLLRNKP